MAGNVLVVDDEPVVLVSCERILTPEGYTVKGASSVKEAMGLLQNGDFDLVITDLKMPEASGIDLIKWLKDNNIKAGIVVITGYPSQETIKDALHMGIIDYLPKPFSPALLVDVTAKAISFAKTKGVEEEKTEEQEIAERAEEIKNVIVTNRNRPGSLIPVLQQVQGILGYLPPAVLKLIARGLNLPVSEVHGVVSFYSFFTMKPKGKHNVRVCMGTACYVKRATEILDKLKGLLGIEEEEVTEDRLFSLETVRCLGACGLAPVVVVDEDTHGSIDPVKVNEMLEEYK
jgi:NADH:ubiquinone oxidoreductase subunit E